MLNKRPIHADIEDMLLNNEPFQYCHLIKFERPYRADVADLGSTSKQRYTYITDASRDVDFNDGSLNASGVANGTQTYVANKVLQVSTVSEDVEARASTFNLVLDGNGIGAVASATATVAAVDSETWDITWPASMDLVAQGFRENDKVIFTGVFSGSFNIFRFRENNVLRIKKIDTNATVGTGTLTISLESEEIKSILLNKNDVNYASFINREVYIYRAYFQDGAIVGEPFLLFKGIISDVSFEDSDSGIRVTWGMTSHWGDFAQVRGRITSDEFHRALNASGVPQPGSALKPAYAYDKGFSHSETSINILAKYAVLVEKQKIKTKKGFFGIGAKVKVKKYLEPEERSTELDFQLQAKSIPVIYGVRNIEGIPIFADTLNDNSSIVYVVYALSEGEINSILDVYINGNSLICNDKADFDARSTQTTDNTVEIICRGRADRGDTLGGSSSVGEVVDALNYYTGQEYLNYGLDYNYNLVQNYTPYVEPATTATSQRGIIDGESIKLTSPQDITIDVFSGKSGQKAASSLVELAKANNFKIQNDYWLGTDTAEYWGPNHRLLDTAYVVVRVVIAEGETSLPSIEFIVKGKAVDCYNYDYSYSHYTKNSGEVEANFNFGDTVSLYNMSNVLINNNVTIIDKWSFYNPDGSENVRFRFSDTPDLDYDEDGKPAVTKFYMKNTSNQLWTMVTYNYVEYSGLVAETLSVVPTSVSNVSSKLQINYPSTTYMGPGNGGDPIDGTIPYMSFNWTGIY